MKINPTDFHKIYIYTRKNPIFSLPSCISPLNHHALFENQHVLLSNGNGVGGHLKGFCALMHSEISFFLHGIEPTKLIGDMAGEPHIATLKVTLIIDAPLTA